mgnify:FL=1
MKEIKYTPEQIRDHKKSELMSDLIAASTVREEMWRYHPENPVKVDIVKEYNILIQIEKDITAELDELDN